MARKRKPAVPDRDLTLEELAGLAGVDPSRLRQIILRTTRHAERGETPEGATLTARRIGKRLLVVSSQEARRFLATARTDGRKAKAGKD